MSGTETPARPAPHASGPGSPRRQGTLGRLWALPVAAHLAALAVVLVALLPVVGTGASFSADEGAAIAQARSLARGGGWIVEHPAPEVDPDGRYYPLELSARGPEGVAPFAKHPLYALVLAAADRAGGVTAMVLLSLLGTVAAAAVAAALARQTSPALARPAVWALGLASPLLFDGYLVIAHTLGAAASGGAVLAAVVAVERRSPRSSVAVGACLVLAVLLRSEATLLGLALAAVTGAVALVDQHHRRAALAVSVVASVSVLAARALEQAWAASLVGGTPGTTGGADADVGLLAGRVQALVLTWFRPGYGDGALVEAALVVMLVSLVLAARVARRYPRDGTAIGALGGVAVAAAVAAVVAHPANLVPGLLVAFPLAAAGLAVLGRDSFPTTATRLVAATFALFAAAVAATQYATGGSGEWGGRYFAIGLPLLVPVALAALERAGSGLDRATARRAAAALVACSIALAAMSVGTLRWSHRFTGRLTRTIASAARAASTDRTPVVVATHAALPRLAWPVADGQRWLLAEGDEVPRLAARLRAAGERRVVLTGHGRPPDAGPGTEVVASDAWASGAGWFVVVVDLEG